MTQGDLQNLLRLTMINPRAAATQIMAQNLPAAFGWTSLLLMSVISAFFGYMGFMLSGGETDPALTALFGSPLRMAVIQLAALALTGVLAFWVGQRFGGKGSLSQALVLVAWAQVPPVLLQLAQLVAIVVAPGFAPLFGIAGFALYAVLLSLFIAQLHGFRSGVLVFFGMIVVSILVAFLVAILFVILIGVPHV